MDSDAIEYLKIAFCASSDWWEDSRGILACQKRPHNELTILTATPFETHPLLS